MGDLRECPFCGSTDIVHRRGSEMPGWDEDVSAEQCRKCEAIGPTEYRRRDDDECLTWNSRAAVEAHGWRPIETAPKDGSLILTYAPRAPHNGYPPVNTNYFEHDAWQKTNSSLWPPTHWQPLPDAPK